MKDPVKHNSLCLLGALKTHRFYLLLLLVLTALTYSDVLTHTFLINWDDQVYITQNPAIRRLTLENLITVSTRYYVGNYAPVQLFSYMIDYSLWGTNPFGYLLANIFYHYVSGTLLFFLLVRLGIEKWGAFIGTAVFLVHPVQIESVAWLSQRKNLLAMLFYLLSFHSYLNYLKTDFKLRNRWYRVSVILFSLSLLAKSVAVILPIMLILYDLLFQPIRSRLKDHVDKIPYFIAAGVVAVLAIISQSSDYGGGRAEYPPNALIALPCTMIPVLVTYLKMLIWPDPSSLSIMYFPMARSSLDMEVLLGIGIVFLLIVVGIACYRKNRPVLFWYSLFFLGLLPVSQLVPLITLMNDRYLYFPMLGVAGIIAHLIAGARANGGEIRGAVVLVASLSAVIALACVSHVRGKVWKDSISLFSDVTAKYPEESTGWSRLAEGYVFKGDLKRARTCYEKAASLGPLDFDANYNLVQLYFDAGEFSTANRHIWNMLLSVSQSKRAMLLLGEYYLYTGSYADAERYLQMFLQDYPDSMHGLFELGQVYLLTGSLERAGDLFSKAVAVGGNHPRLFLSMACVELRSGNKDKSVAIIQSAIEAGLSAKDLRVGDACLDDIFNEPRLRQMIEQHVRE